MGGIHTVWPRDWAAWAWPAILAQSGNKGCNNRENNSACVPAGSLRGEQSKLEWVGAERFFREVTKVPRSWPRGLFPLTFPALGQVLPPAAET